MILEIVTDQGVMNGGSEEKVTVTSERSDARLFVTSIPLRIGIAFRKKATLTWSDSE